MRRTLTSILLVSTLLLTASAARLPAAAQHHYLYVAEPGIRNYVEYGGVGILVYDIDAGYKFVRRIPSQVVRPGRSRKTSRASRRARPPAGST